MHRGLTLAVGLALGVGLSPGGEAPAVRGDLSAADLARVRAVTAPATDFTEAEAFEAMQGGAGTIRKVVNRDVFSFPAANLTFEEEERFKLGNALFRKLWVSSPSSTAASDGLGPLFNARGCQNCHLKDGRGRPPDGGDSQSMFLRLSIPPPDETAQALLDARAMPVVPEPTYGTQLQSAAVQGLTPEGRMVIDYAAVPVTLGDGTVVQLRAPTYSVADLGYGPLAPGTMLSPRVAPQMIGLGLIEEIPAEDILARADPEDADGDGISGRPNWVRDPASGEIMLGRFGWKAGAPTIMAQSAGAFAGDIGISTPLYNTPYGDCTGAQEACLGLPTGVQARLGDSEAPDPVLPLVTFYSQTLGVPQRRDVDDAQVLAGKQLFYASGCAGCHVPKYVTSRAAEIKEQAFQLIWPYTDLLLHDMGQGLADQRPEADATGTEWRTPPLWGIGLTEVVSGHTFFLHDGRARTLEEAILWHGGEAQRSRDAYAAMSKTDRDALVAFLESL